MHYSKRIVSWLLSLCLMLSLFVGIGLPTQAADNGKIKVTCVGDSITAGYKSTNGMSYPSQMQKILGDGYEVLNAGSSGSTVIRSLDEGYNKRDVYSKGLESKPDIVIIMIGTNDAILGGVNKEEGQKNFRKDYAALIEDYQKCGSNPKIILAVPTTSVDEKNLEDNRDRNNENYLIPIIQDLAKQYNLQLLDTHTYSGSWTRESSGTRNKYLADGLHPNNAGYGELAKFFANAIRGYKDGFTGDIQKETNYTIVSRSSGKAMTIENYSENNSAGLCQMTNGNYESQVWKLIPTEDGYYQIQNQYSGKVLDVPNKSTKEGTQIIQYDKGNGDNQKWELIATGDGYWRITPKLVKEQALNVSGNSKDDGGIIVQWPYAGAANEQWRIQVVQDIKKNPEAPIRVTCVGDSITEGYKSTNGMSYPSQLQTILGNGYTVLNAGSSGSTVIRSLDEGYNKRGVYSKGLNSKPDVVIIMIGTNDAILGGVNKEEGQTNFRKDYAALIEDYQKCGSNPKIILAVPTTSVDEKNGEDNRDNNNEKYLIPIIEDLAKQYNLQLLDTHTYSGSWTRESSGTRNKYLADGLHPNNDGYGELAKFFANAILGYTQKFTGDIQEDTKYTITSKSSGMAMTVTDYSTDANAGICQMNNGSYESQIWKLVPTEDGYYQIVNQFSGKALEVSNASTAQDTQIVQANVGTADSQKWEMIATGDGNWRITPKLVKDFAMVISGDAKAEGSIVVQSNYVGNDNDQWRLTAVQQVNPNPAAGQTVSTKLISFEAETTTYADGAELTPNAESSNGYYIGFIGGVVGGTATFTVNAEAAGARTLNIYYASDENRTMDVVVNGASNVVSFPANGSWTKTGEQPVSVRITLKQGDNTIKFAGANGGNAPNVDRFEFALTDTEIKNAVTSLINSIPENVTDTDKDKALVNGVKLAYDKLDETAKKEIANISKLETAIQKLEGGVTTPGDTTAPGDDDSTAENPNTDQKAAQTVIDSITAIGTVTLESESNIKAVRAAYDALTENQKKLVTNYEVLTQSEKQLDELKGSSSGDADVEIPGESTDGDSNGGTAGDGSNEDGNGATTNPDITDEDNSNDDTTEDGTGNGGDGTSGDATPGDNDGDVNDDNATGGDVGNNDDNAGNTGGDDTISDSEGDSNGGTTGDNALGGNSGDTNGDSNGGGNDEDNDGDSTTGGDNNNANSGNTGNTGGDSTNDGTNGNAGDDVNGGMNEDISGGNNNGETGGDISDGDDDGNISGGDAGADNTPGDINGDDSTDGTIGDTSGGVNGDVSGDNANTGNVNGDNVSDTNNGNSNTGMNGDVAGGSANGNTSNGNGTGSNNIPAGNGNNTISQGTTVQQSDTSTTNSNASQGVKLQSIKIKGISKKIAAGKKIELEAVVKPLNAKNLTVIWSSSDERYATVDEYGVVSTKKAGKNKKVTITAKAADGGGAIATYKITIVPNAVKQIIIKAKSLSVQAGKQLKLTADVASVSDLILKKMNTKLVWSSSNTKYATVTSNGVVKTKSAGRGKKVRITAKATDGSNKKKTVTITIK